jgi:hypothetical protein
MSYTGRTFINIYPNASSEQPVTDTLLAQGFTATSFEGRLSPEAVTAVTT